MKSNPTTSSRQTKYMTAVLEALEGLGHATNAELLQSVQLGYPEASATTVHRVTARLQTRGVIGLGPKTIAGAVRYDRKPEPHHHFMCTACGGTCDVPETARASRVFAQLQSLSEHCALAGSLTLSGVCKECETDEVARKS